MLERLGEYAPDAPSHRLLVGCGFAVAGVLAVGDGLRVVRFPLYTLGLPDTLLADAAVTALGLGLFVAAARLVRSAIDEDAQGTDRADAPLADGGTTDAGDPLAVLERRYARGEIGADEFERRKATLDGSDRDGDPADRQTQITQQHGLADREATIE